MQILVSNVGSTSLKFKLFAMPQEEVLCTAKVERVGSETAIYQYTNEKTGWTRKETAIPVRSYAEGIELFLRDMTDAEHGTGGDIREVGGVGFKTVLGKNCDGVFELTDQVLSAMRAYLFIAPAHNGPYLTAIGEFNRVLPDVPKIGVFETAYHATIPMKNRMYGIPYEWVERYGITRKGYHGASFTYLAEQARTDGDWRNIIGCHLGGSCSVCAIQDGKSFDDSFGFSLQTGLLHANRCGDTDAYLFPFLQDAGLSRDEIIEGLSKRGGLLGISGVSNDLREIEAAADAGNARAKLAIDVFVTSVVRYIGAFYAELGGLDKLVFTGGIGENSARIREMICGALPHLGIRLDPEKNRTLRGEGYISAAYSPVRVQVIPANEELGVARQTYRRILSGADMTVEQTL